MKDAAEGFFWGLAEVGCVICIGGAGVGGAIIGGGADPKLMLPPFAPQQDVCEA